MKANQVDFISSPVPGYLKQIVHTHETRLHCQLMGNVSECDLLNGIHMDRAFTYLVKIPSLHTRALPDANAASDGTPAHTFPKPLCENHR